MKDAAKKAAGKAKRAGRRLSPARPDQSVKNRMQELTAEFVGHPFLPILFLGEAAKQYVANGWFLHAPSPATARFTVMGVVLALVWTYADKWRRALREANNAVDEVTSDE